MKLFGYLSSTPEQQAPLELSEVTLSASSEELREIAGFLLHAAENMDQLGKSFDHMHLSESCVSSKIHQPWLSQLVRLRKTANISFKVDGYAAA